MGSCPSDDVNSDPTKLYGDNLTHKCEPCSSLCMYCYGPLNNNCTGCNPPYFLDAELNACGSNCRAGYVKNTLGYYC